MKYSSWKTPKSLHLLNLEKQNKNEQIKKIKEITTIKWITKYQNNIEKQIYDYSSQEN